MPARQSPSKSKTKARAASEKRAADKKAPDYRITYVKLRTVLDALEMGSLRFCLSGKTNEERDKRAEKLMKLLRPAVKQIEKWDKDQSGKAESMAEPECPPGYYECDGCCVPYPCPGNIDGVKEY